MDRAVHALVQVARGQGATKQYPIRKVEGYQVETAIDTDADAFSVTFGDPTGELLYLTDRDVESKVTLFLSNEAGKVVPIFSGITDEAVFTTDDFNVNLSGRDMSCLAVDSDAPAGRWRHVKPKPFLAARAHKLGMTNVQIASMREIGTLYTDASETEWAFWYRIVRSRGFFMWTGPLGTLFIDHLNNTDTPTYHFGSPGKGAAKGNWMMPKSVSVHNTKQRKAEVWVYGEDAKTGRPFYSRSVDILIKNWKRKPLSIVTSSSAKSNKEAKEDADEEVFESIVGAYQIELVLHDTGTLIQQNRMAQLHLEEPLSHLNGVYFVVGVTRVGGADGFTQVVRLRQRHFAVSKRVPDPPKITEANDPASTKLASSMGSILTTASTADGRPLPWADHFIGATKEFGVPAGWDFAVFLGVLLAICDQESGFQNVRETSQNADAINHYEWQPYDVFQQDSRQLSIKSEHAIQAKYEKTFANAQDNPLNPRYPSSESGVGPMQLTYQGFKDWADQFGWLGKPRAGEYQGGRWNPRSNIRAAAKALIYALGQPPAADPNNPNSIWIGVGRYHGASDPAANQTYITEVKKRYDNSWAAIANTTVLAGQTLPVGTQTKITVNGQTYEAPANTPDIVKKAINFCLRRLGDNYDYGGGGPLYDCSSLVTAAYAAADPGLRAELDEPRPGYHGETTYTLFGKDSTTGKSRFPVVSRDALLPGDLLFFFHDGGSTPEHVGMFLGEGRMVHDPKTGDVVKVSDINSDYYRDHYLGARRLAKWPAPLAQPPTDIFTVMIQAGHDPGGHIDQPYGHEGQSGAAGELDFTMSVRDKVLALMDSDARFAAKKGTAWSASAGALPLAFDDEDFHGDLFVSIHYDRGTAGSGYFFGYTRGATDGRSDTTSANSAKLANFIGAEIDKIAGAPPRLTPDNNNFGGSPANATGWGYYAWGSDLRASPDNIDHTPGVTAHCIVECGRANDGTYLDTKQSALANAIYTGICSYFKVRPLG
jgi:cell wall-associated NlpC family hydrolase/prophage tail gpP-like protein